jgi:hypothetical protein
MALAQTPMELPRFGPATVKLEDGLESCGTCGHSRRNHEEARASCARSLCACGRFS